MDMRKTLILLLPILLIIYHCRHEPPVQPNMLSDLTVEDIIGPPNAEVDKADTWQVVVRNVGMTTIQAFTVVLFMADDVELASQDVSIPMAPKDTMVVDIQWTPTVLGLTTLCAEVITENDVGTLNNRSNEWDVYIFNGAYTQIFIWDNDNRSTYHNPEGLYSWNCEFGLMRALQNDYLEYQIHTELPRILRNYDIVFVELGLFCPS